MLVTCEQPHSFGNLGSTELQMYSSAQGNFRQEGRLAELEPLRGSLLSLVDSQAGVDAVSLQQLDLTTLAPNSLLLPQTNHHRSGNDEQFNGIASCYTLDKNVQQFVSADQPSSPGMYLSSQASTQPQILLQQPASTFTLVQDHSSLATLPPDSAALPLDSGMVSDVQYNASLLLQLQQLQLDHQQQELQQLLAEHEQELEQLRMLVQQQQGSQQQMLNRGGVAMMGRAAPSHEAVSYYHEGPVVATEEHHAGGYAAASGPSTAAASQPCMYLLQPPRQSASQRRHSMLQLQSNPLHAVSEEVAGAVDHHDADRAPAQRRSSMVQLQSHTALPAEAGASGAAVTHAGRSHRGPLRAASWGGAAFREAGLGPVGTHSPTQSSQHTATEPIMDVTFYQPSGPAGPGGGPRSMPMVNQGYSRVRRNSNFQVPGPNNLVVVAEEADRPEEKPDHQRRGPNHAASWAAQTFARRLNPRCGSVDLQGPRDAAARNAAGYEQPAGGAMAAAAGLASRSSSFTAQGSSSSFTEPASRRARRNSAEAPKWAGAFWNPMAEVVKSGQLANGGTGVFIPKSMQLALAEGGSKDAKTKGSHGGSP